MNLAESVALGGISSYLVFAAIVDLFAAYKMATDQRFGRRKRYIYAFLILALPAVEWLYIGHLAYVRKSYFMRRLGSVKEKLADVF